MIRRGEILLLSFPFTDMRSNKVRPALVVSTDSLNRKGEDVIFAFITTKEYNGPFDLRVAATDPSFQATGLKESSTLRISKLMCLEQRLARRRLGRADARILGRVEAALRCLFDLPGRVDNSNSQTK